MRGQYGGNGYYFQNGGGGQLFAYTSDGGNLVETASTSAVSTGSWYHLVFVKTGNSSTNGQWFVNGVAVSMATQYFETPVSDTTDPMLLGAGPNGGTLSLAEVRFQAVALSSAWIAADYNNQSAPNTFWTVGSLH